MSSQAIDEAIQCAQEAVQADESGDFAAAIEKYKRSVNLIQRGLQIKREDETVDNTALQRYYKLYTARIAVLQDHASVDEAAASSSEHSAAGKQQPLFTFDDSEVSTAPLPSPPPAEEWRRVFWLMGMLRTSMTRGGYISSDGRVYVPKRVWLQKSAKLAAQGTKLDCAESLVNELRQVVALDYTQPKQVTKGLASLCELLDSLQASLSRQIPLVAEMSEKRPDSGARVPWKGIAKSLDRTVGRLSVMPSRPPDPHEYVHTLVDLFDAASFVEVWIDHYGANALENAVIYQQLRRVARFLYEVVCAFVVQDLDVLLERYLKKASAGFLKP